MIDCFGLVPRPDFADFYDDCVLFDSMVVLADEFFWGTAELCSTQFCELGVSCVCKTPSENNTNSSCDKPLKVFLEKKSSFLSQDSYDLTISLGGVVVKAGDCAGAFYGMQTVRQLVMTADRKNGNVRLPLCTIKDTPEYQWRGFMLDTCRHFQPVGFIKKLIDVAAMHKLNRFHWHLTDDQGWRLYIPEYPLLTEIGAFRYNSRAMWLGKTGGFYSHDDIREVVEYAMLRHVTVVPEIETPGHASAVLASYPGLGCTGGPYRVEERYGIFDDVLCAGNDEVLKVFSSVFETVCDLFPGEYVHIGGDECPRTNWKTCPKCQSRMKSEGLHSEDELQNYLTVRFASMLEQKGKIPIGWDEVLDGTENLGLPKSLVVQSWRGIEGGRRACELGHKVVMSPQTQGCYLDYKNYDDETEPGWIGCATVKKSYDFSPVPKGCDISKDFVLGGQGNLWTEVIYAPRIAEYMLFPRLCALAECLWLSQDKKDFEDFSNRLEVHKKRLDLLDVNYYRGKLE